MVTAPASTGITAIRRYAVISQVHTNSGMRSSVIPGARMFMMVTTMLMAPRIEEAPIRWTENTSIGKDAPVCSTSGGYMVQLPAGASYPMLVFSVHLMGASSILGAINIVVTI